MVAGAGINSFDNLFGNQVENGINLVHLFI